MSSFLDWSSLAVAVLALVLGLATWRHQARLAREQRVRELELVYVQRYWQIRYRMSTDLRLDKPSEIAEPDRRVLLDYLELCEDEADARAHGWISDSTWQLWSQGVCGAADAYLVRIVPPGMGTDSFTRLRSVVEFGREGT